MDDLVADALKSKGSIHLLTHCAGTPQPSSPSGAASPPRLDPVAEFIAQPLHWIWLERDDWTIYPAGEQEPSDQLRAALTRLSEQPDVVRALPASLITLEEASTLLGESADDTWERIDAPFDYERQLDRLDVVDRGTWSTYVARHRVEELASARVPAPHKVEREWFTHEEAAP